MSMKANIRKHKKRQSKKIAILVARYRNEKAIKNLNCEIAGLAKKIIKLGSNETPDGKTAKKINTLKEAHKKARKSINAHTDGNKSLNKKSKSLYFTSG